MCVYRTTIKKECVCLGSCMEHRDWEYTLLYTGCSQVVLCALLVLYYFSFYYILIRDVSCIMARERFSTIPKWIFFSFSMALLTFLFLFRICKARRNKAAFILYKSLSVFFFILRSPGKRSKVAIIYYFSPLLPFMYPLLTFTLFLHTSPNLYDSHGRCKYGLPILCI